MRIKANKKEEEEKNTSLDKIRDSEKLEPRDIAPKLNQKDISLVEERNPEFSPTSDEKTKNMRDSNQSFE